MPGPARGRSPLTRPEAGLFPPVFFLRVFFLRGYFLRGFFLPVLFLALFSAGCSDYPTGPVQTTGSGRISGRVSAGVPGPFALTFRSASGGNYQSFDRETDSAGAFDVSLPAGLYVLGVYSPELSQIFWYRYDGWTRIEEFGSRLRAQKAGLHLELRLASLRVDLRLPQELDSLESTGCVIRRQSGGAEFRYRGMTGTGFDFGLVPPDHYLVRYKLSERNTTAVLWSRATIDSSLARWIEVPPAQATIYTDTIPSPGHLRGTFFSVAGPGTPCSVIARGQGGIPVATASVSSDGSFDLPVFGSGPFNVATLVQRGLPVERWLGGSSQETAHIYSMTLGGTVDLGTIRDTGILCRFLQSPQPESFRLVIDLVPGRWFWTDQDSLLIPNLNPGAYRLHFTPVQPWSPQWFDRALTEPTADPVVTSDGELEKDRCPARTRHIGQRSCLEVRWFSGLGKRGGGGSLSGTGHADHHDSGAAHR